MIDPKFEGPPDPTDDMEDVARDMARKGRLQELGDLANVMCSWWNAVDREIVREHVIDRRFCWWLGVMSVSWAAASGNRRRSEYRRERARARRRAS